ncbi:MAG: hypothetical protein RR277_08825 [Rikenellaceae bacterium]
MDNQEFYVVGIYHTSYQANVVQTLLASNGVESEVINAEINVLYPFTSNDSFCVKVIANMSDKDKIEQILTSSFDKNDLK